MLGGGIAGLAAAIALDRAGYRVTVIERAQRLEPLGAALSLWRNAMIALEMLGIADPLRAGAAPISALAVSARNDVPIIPPIAVTDAWLPTRAWLQRCLLGGLGTRTELRLGQTAFEAVERAEGVAVRLAGGDHLHADLVIDASGIHSSLADRLLHTSVTPRSYAGVLAIAPARAQAGDGIAREYWADGARFGLFDLGTKGCYWFFMRNAAPGAATPALDECAAAACGWPDTIGHAIAATPADRLIPFEICARALPRRLGGGRIICIGDAAHAMEPNLGQGACLGLEDAAVLGILASRLPPDAILPAFEARRLRRVRTIMRASARAGRLVHNGRLVDAAVRRLLPLAPSALHRRVIVKNQSFTLPA